MILSKLKINPLNQDGFTVVIFNNRNGKYMSSFSSIDYQDNYLIQDINRFIQLESHIIQLGREYDKNQKRKTLTKKKVKV